MCWSAASRIIVYDVIELIINFKSIRTIFDSPQRSSAAHVLSHARELQKGNGHTPEKWDKRLRIQKEKSVCVTAHITLHLTFIQIWYFMFALIRKPFMIKFVLLLHPVHSKHMWFDHSYDNNVSLYPALFAAIHKGFCASLKLKARIQISVEIVYCYTSGHKYHLCKEFFKYLHAQLTHNIQMWREYMTLFFNSTKNNISIFTNSIHSCTL